MINNWFPLPFSLSAHAAAPSARSLGCCWSLSINRDRQATHSQIKAFMNAQICKGWLKPNKQKKNPTNTVLVWLLICGRQYPVGTNYWPLFVPEPPSQQHIQALWFVTLDCFALTSGAAVPLIPPPHHHVGCPSTLVLVWPNTLLLSYWSTRYCISGHIFIWSLKAKYSTSWWKSFLHVEPGPLNGKVSHAQKVPGKWLIFYFVFKFYILLLIIIRYFKFLLKYRFTILY